MVNDDFWSRQQRPSRPDQQPGQAPASAPEQGQQAPMPQEKEEDAASFWSKQLTPNTYSRPPEPEEEGWVHYIGRNLAAGAARAGEAAAGSIGAMEKFGKEYLAQVPKSGTNFGNLVKDYIGEENWNKAVWGPGKQPGETMAPTPEQLKGATKSMTGESLEPKGPGEAKFQQFAETVGSTVNPFTRMTKGRQALLNHFGVPAASEAVESVVKGMGFKEDKASLAKMGSQIALSLIGNVNGRAHAINQKRGAEQFLSVHPGAQPAPFYRRLTDIERNMAPGDPRSALARQQIGHIQEDIQNGRTDMEDLFRRYDAINAVKRDRGLFELNPTDRRAAIRNINQVRDVVRGEIQNASRAYPGAFQQWSNGVKSLAVIHQTEALTRWAQNIVKGPYKHLAQMGIGSLFGITGASAAAKLPGIANSAVAIGAPAAYKTGQVLVRVLSDRNLANYYWRAIAAAEAQNIPNFVKNYEKLGNKYEKDYPEKR